MSPARRGSRSAPLVRGRDSLATALPHTYGEGADCDPRGVASVSSSTLRAAIRLTWQIRWLIVFSSDPHSQDRRLMRRISRARFASGRGRVGVASARRRRFMTPTTQQCVRGSPAWGDAPQVRYKHSRRPRCHYSDAIMMPIRRSTRGARRCSRSARTSGSRTGRATEC